MTVYSIWGQAAPSPSPSSGSSGGGRTYSTIFTLSSSGSLTGIWYYSFSADGSLPTACGVFDVATKTLVASNTSPSWSGALGSGWVKCTFDGSVTLDNRADGYAVSIQYPLATKGFNNVTFPITSGIITAPTADTYGTTNAPLAGASTLTYPNTSGGGLNWFADVEVTTGAGTNPAGTVQPLATVPIARRHLTRALVQRITGQGVPQVPAPAQQPRPSPGRAQRRASVRFVPVTTTNAHGPNGTVQPYTARPAARRTLARASVRFVPVTTINAPPIPQVGGNQRASGRTMLKKRLLYADL